MNLGKCLIAGAALVFACVCTAQDAGDATPWFEEESEPVVATPEGGAGDPEAESSAEAPDEETVATIPVEAPPEAAPKGATVLDVIEVTASKRVKSQRDIPGSVGAIRGADLEKISAQEMADYLKLVPGVVFIDQGRDNSIPIIRGISTSLGSGATGGTTGIYLDDMPFADLLGSSSFPDLNPFDLDRVEVLKGPQGTLFGSGALAGAVRYIVQRPKMGIWETKLSGTVTDTRMGGLSKVGAGAVNVPIGNDIALRGVGVLRERGGIYDESAYDDSGNELRNEKDVDKLEQVSWRAMASWNALDNLQVSALYFDQQTDTDGLSLSSDPEEATFDAVPFASPRESGFGGGNLLATWDLDWFRVLSSTNRMTKDVYSATHQEFGLGLGNQNDNEFVTASGTKVDGYTQEFRVSSPEGGTGRWEWLAGGSFLHYGSEGWQYTYAGPDQPDPKSPDEVTEEQKLAAQVFATSEEVAEETAFFGEITGRLGQAWELTVGARQYKTVLDGSGVICGAQIAVLFPDSGGCRPDTFGDKETGLNPKVSLRYLHSRNIQAYALVAKGFQFGGVQINPPAPGFAEAAEREGYRFAPFKSSVLWNYEMGLRTEWLDRRLRLDVTAFYMDWTELQLTVVVPLVAAQPDTGFAVIANVGQAHSEGLEAALEVLPFDGARFTSSATWMNAVTDVDFDENNPSGPVPAGTRLPGTPRFQWANVAAYERTLPYFTDWVGGLALTHVHLGSSPDNIRAEGTVGGYDTFDARLNFAKPGSQYLPELTLGVGNVTDVRGLSYHNDVNGTQLVHFVTPRTVTATVAWRF